MDEDYEHLLFLLLFKKMIHLQERERVKKNKRRFWVIQSVNTNTNTNKRRFWVIQSVNTNTNTNKRRFWVIQSVNTNTNTNKSVCRKVNFT